MRIIAAVEGNPVALFVPGLGWTLATPLTLPGFVAAALVLPGKHEELFARDTPTPQEGGHHDQREHRTGNTPEHVFIIPHAVRAAYGTVSETGTSTSFKRLPLAR